MSDKVGGDLVDSLFLADASNVAYIADVALTALAAAILTGMPKTAARTALPHAQLMEPGAVSAFSDGPSKSSAPPAGRSHRWPQPSPDFASIPTGASSMHWPHIRPFCTTGTCRRGANLHRGVSAGTSLPYFQRLFFCIHNHGLRRPAHRRHRRDS